ncbi:hypothetical protein D3C73_1615170 [compost metagenome]
MERFRVIHSGIAGQARFKISGPQLTRIGVSTADADMQRLLRGGTADSFQYITLLQGS